MPVKIRLARHGRKGQPFYHIVIADSKAPRDGRFIERIGSYNPIVNPAAIDLNFDRALYWLMVGAQPTDTTRNILSKKGVLMKKHLLEGVKKGALSEEQAEVKFQAWLKEKENKVQSEVNMISTSAEKAKKKQLELEAKLNEERAQAIAKKRSDAAKALTAAKESENDAPAE